MKKLNLSYDQKKKIKEIAAQNKALLIVVFGSQARREKNKKSDFDLAVLTAKKPCLKLFNNLFCQFSQVFKGESIDLRFLNEADPFFRFQVIKDGQLIYGSLRDYNRFKVYALKIYLDNGRKYFPYLKKLLIKNQRELERSIYD